MFRNWQKQGWVLVLALFVVWCLPGPTLAAMDQTWPPLELSLTGSAADGVTTVYIRLLNKLSRELSDLTVTAGLPEGATFVSAELLSAANPGRLNGSVVEFHVEHLSGGAALGPLTYRFKTVPQSNKVRVHAWAMWTRPTPGTAISPELSLAVLNYMGRPASENSPRADRLSALLNSNELKGIQLGAMVYDLDQARTVYQYNQQQALVPASNAKLFTAAAALQSLGPDYRFRTVVGREGDLGSDGVLAGNLIVRGYGDPTLQTETLGRWADSLVSAGLKGVSGDLLLDTTFFDSEPTTVGWAWDAESESYQPRTGALSVNENRIALVVESGEAAGAPAKMRTEPSLSALVVDNRVTTAEAGKTWHIEVKENGAALGKVEGEIPLGGQPIRREMTAKDPGLYTGLLLKDLLAARGVIFSATSAVRHGVLPAGATLLVQHRSVPLSQILAHMLKPSDNFISEQLLKALGAEVVGQGSSLAGQQVIKEFLKVNGLTMSYALCDACGLSLDNQVSPEMLVGLLVLMDGHRYGDSFRAALAVAGVDGTMASRLKKAPTRGRVQAKTGSLLGTSTLSGYAATADGRRLAFSILMNGSTREGWARVQTMRNIQDEMVAVLVGK